MRCTALQFLAASSLLFALSSGPAATRPHYGGTLRMEIGVRVLSLDLPVPAVAAAGSAGAGSSAGWPEEYGEARAASKLRALVYDRLVRVDSRGQPQPSLAVSWEHDAQSVNWRFKLRSAVKWQDGSPMTAAEVAAGLESVISGRGWSVVDDTLEIDTGSPRPEFPLYLATAPAAVVIRKSGGPTSVPSAGTGPFRVAEWEPGRRAVLVANEEYWGGRAYLDSIQVEMGRSSRERLLDVELDKADLAELDPAEARRAQQGGRRVWTSAPVEVLALVFNPASRRAQDRRLREAIARSIDRFAIQRVLLQNYGEATGSLLPQWLSGSAFMFPTTADLGRARQLSAEVGTVPQLKLGYEASDTLARQVAERIAVNVRDGGILLGVASLTRGWRQRSGEDVDAVVWRARIDGPTLELAALQCSEWFGFPANGFKTDSPDEVYAAEKRFLNDFTTVPLADVPELVGLGPRVRNWAPPRSGDWRLDDVWLEAGRLVTPTVRGF